MTDYQSIGSELKRRLNSYAPGIDVKSAGVALQVTDGVVEISGLADCCQGEMLEMENGG